MQIGIDGYETNTDKRVGIGQYAFQLISHLYQIDRKNSYTLFLQSRPRTDMPPQRYNWKYIVGKSQPLWTINQLPSLIRMQPLDLFFSPTHYLPWVSQIPKILSIMDLSYIHFPQLFKIRDLLKLKYMGLFSIKRAKKILTISEFTRREIIEHYKYPKDDVVVTYPGLALKSSNRKLQKKVKRFDRYLLFVGTFQPRKNIIRLIQAFELIGDKELHLVLVGKKGWLYEPIFKAIRESPKRDKIIYLDFISNSELVDLYRQAVCLVMPSLYEGFGIPIVEAFSLDCPVVVSNTTSLPEVAGAAGIYVDPMQTEDIARGINKVLQLSQREREILVKEGQKQIKKFTWERCAQKTLEVFNTML